MRTKVVIAVVCVLNLVLQAGCDVDAEELQEAITDAFSPDFTFPNYQPSLTRINEIRASDLPEGENGILFTYETDQYHRGENIQFIRYPQSCDTAFTYIDWSDEGRISRTYTGSVNGDFNPYRPEDLESFMAAAEKWIFSHDAGGFLQKVGLEDEPETFRSFSYNTITDFYDSIVEYREGVHQKTLKYQYAADQWELISILELGPSYDTLAVYTFEMESPYVQNSMKDPLYKSLLIGIPNTSCMYLYLHGPLWAWHFPFALKRLYKDGILVYEASFEVDGMGFPYQVHYSRSDDTGNMMFFSEEILTEVIKL